MNLLVPAALWFGLLAGPILLLYMLKLRRKSVTISSTMLWRRLLRDRQANVPWQRLKRNLLLLLQLLILAALVLAIARPVQSVPGVSADTVIILLDASASMNAEDVTPSRFEAARQIVQSLISDLPTDARMTIISAGPEARTLIAAQSDHGALQAVLAEAQPDQGPADWQSAFTLAAGAAASVGQASVATVIVSDGGLPDEGLPALPGDIHYLPVGRDNNNVAITALAVRPGPENAELFTRVKNYGSLSQKAILTLYADGQILESRQIELEGGRDQLLTLSDLPEEAVRFEARLQPISSQAEAFHDNLPLDNQAATVFHPIREGRVLLVSPGNLFLEQVLASIEGIQAYRLPPTEDGSFQMPQEEYDLYVFDGWLPDPIPPGNQLWVDPPANALFATTGVFTNTAPAEILQSPLTEFIDWQAVHILQARRIQLPDWAQVLIQAPGGPLVFTGDRQNQRLAAITFDLHESDLPLQLAFPILMANLIDYLQPGDLFHLADLPGLQPGQQVSLPASTSSGTLLVTDPSGNSTELQADQDSRFLLQPNQTGIYSLADPAQPGMEAFLAVNLFSPQESDLTPATNIVVAQKPISANHEMESGQREFWPWLAVAALLILWLEWWLYYRRQVIPTDWSAGIKLRLQTLRLKLKSGGVHE
jgi:Ca-activated chloride channel family protein